VKQYTHSILCNGWCFLFGILLIFLSSCQEDSLGGWIILTQVPAVHNDPGPEEITGYQDGSMIIAVNPDKPGGDPLILTGSFFSACAPALSWNAEILLFSAKKTASDPWQVWLMSLEDLTAFPVTTVEKNCLDPVYLPNDRIAFSMTESGIFTCNLDGSDLRQINFHPHSEYALNVMQDGRILYLSRQKETEKGSAMFMAMRPDGTKSELFYNPRENTMLRGRGFETADNGLVFVETSTEDPSEAGLMKLNINRPLFSVKSLSDSIVGSYHSVYPLDSDSYLVSYRNEYDKSYGVYYYDAVGKKIGSKLFSEPNFHCIDPVYAGVIPRPRKLPSEVKEDEKTGLLFCQDVRVSRIITNTHGEAGKEAEIIQVWGIDSLMGDLKVEEDGSFYLEVQADTPIRFLSLDSKGNTVRGPSAWIWVRPNERRGCVGCHADPELSPVNRVAVAVRKSPVSITPENEIN
jgi:hypothetical protein